MTSLLERIAGGDSAAVEKCLDQYGGLVWSLARRMTPSTAEAEDAVQEIFIDVWKSASSFDSSKASEKTFIAMIARRRLIDRLRRAERRPEVQPLPDVPLEVPYDHHKTIQKGVEASAAARTLAILPEDQRKVIGLSIYLGMSHREISESTGIPIGTVKSHIFRGLKAVRERLAEAESGEAG